MASEAPPTRAVRASDDAAGTASEDARGRRGDLWAGLDHSTTMSMELLAGILVWGGVGWLVDGWLGTRPWLFVVGTLLGFGAGLYLVWHRAHALEREQAPTHGEQGPGHGHGDEDGAPAQRAVRDSR